MSSTRKPRRKAIGTYFEVVAGDLRDGSRRRFLDGEQDAATTFAEQHRALARRIDVYSDGTEHVIPLERGRLNAYGEGSTDYTPRMPGAMRTAVKTTR